MEVYFFGWNEFFVVQLFVVQLFLCFGFRVDDDLELGNVVFIDCNIFGEVQSEYCIGQGVLYLCGLLGKVSNNLGKCGCVSCFYYIVIYWCNEVCFGYFVL